jgi:hypothetical protein
MIIEDYVILIQSPSKSESNHVYQWTVSQQQQQQHLSLTAVTQLLLLLLLLLQAKQTSRILDFPISRYSRQSGRLTDWEEESNVLRFVQKSSFPNLEVIVPSNQPSQIYILVYINQNIIE